ncbi:MopB_phenylacetyl-CoA family molybdopterin oxidoreductase [Desulfitobacterium hafniense]|uniref:MopB_phenylacetyl-CoA family molybdopterin oxidoreductase n=1 Tax=Desulfitobacterium hafniense TaxID=49338 RepID=A0A098B761_DESHA|nr:molybdopterin-dependent oxidoreductase [Desulfitobacterium hafniense]CDX04182.1 MopB_phenylacetyl-CoA family molybdopterin oxidoreductase [Desulfitobacterium hafniense]
MFISRRNFIKGAAAVGAAGALSVELGLPQISAFAEGTTPTGKKKRFSYCRMCMESDCGLIVTEENGVVVDVSGNPDCLSNKGMMCPRGKSIIFSLYNPYRIKAPMKRTNPKRGFDVDPGWVEISWDEAVAMVGDKIREIAKNDPREIIVNGGFATMDFFTTFLKPAFIAMGSGSNFNAAGGQLCAVHYATGMMQGAFPTAVADYVHGRYIISMGKNAGANFAIATDGVSIGFADSLVKGARHIIIDPRCGMDASMGEWVPIKPGEDLAFLLGMMNVMMYENGKLDFKYLTQHSNAPYLVKEDHDYYRGASGKPQMWDGNTNSAKDFDDPTNQNIALEGEFTVNGVKIKTGFTLIKEAVKEYTAEWAENRCTVPAATIRRIANEFIEYANIGGTIELDGHILPLRQSSLNMQRGSLNHEDGGYIDLVSKLINMLVGALDVPGGNTSCLFHPLTEPDVDGVNVPKYDGAVHTPFSYPLSSFGLLEYFPHCRSTAHWTYRTMLDPEKYGLKIRPKALLVFGGNPISSSPDPEPVAKAFIEKIPFIASFAYHMDEPTILSDVILPVHSPLETMSICRNFGPMNAITEQCITNENMLFRDPVDPIHNTKLPNEIIMDIFEHAGMLPAFNSVTNQVIFTGEESDSYLVHLPPHLQLDPGKRYTTEEIWDRALKATYGDEYGIDYLRKNGIIDSRISPAAKYNYSHFPGNKTRITFYLHNHWKNGQRLMGEVKRTGAVLPPKMSVERWQEAYQPVPVWRETYLMKAKEGYDLRAFNFKMTASIFRFSIGDTNPWLIEWSEKYNPYFNVAMMNTATAAAKGLKSGDMVVIESAEGRKIQGKLLVTELIHPEALGIGGALGRYHKSLGKNASDKTLFWNNLITVELDRMDPVTGAVEAVVNVKVYKA